MTNQQKNYGSAMYTLVTVFFFWGFVAASNGIFIPYCKAHFDLTQFESQLIDFTFYGGYFIGSLVLYFVSQVLNVDLLNKIGYKNGIIYGLVISAIGALLMIPSVHIGSFGFILTSFFVIALGFSLQQTAANPFAVALGTPETGANRLNLAGGVTNLGSLLGPIIVSVVLFGTAVGASTSKVEITSIDTMYYILAGLFLSVATFFFISKLPDVTSREKIESSKRTNFPLLILLLAFILILAVDPLSEVSGLPGATFVYASLVIIVITLFLASNSARNEPEGWGAMKYPQLILGMLAIFTYVGVEVSIQSNFGALLNTPAFGNYHEADIAPFISLYWGSLMIGRWTGAVSAFNIKKSTRRILTVVVPFFAFGVILLSNKVTGTDISGMYVYVVSILIMVICFFFSQEKPAKTLAIFSILGVVAMLIGLLTKGDLAIYAFISGGLCCSIMWPSIFALSITGLGKYTSQGSSFLIMMILGGAIIPPVQGIFADNSSIHLSYLIPVVCFMYLLFFAWKVSKELKKQGFDVHSIETDGH